MIASRRFGRALIVFLLLISSCRRGNVTRDDWQRMSPENQRLIVQALRGHDDAVARKGGPLPRKRLLNDDEYRKRITALYHRGENRPVEEIWNALPD